MGDIPNNIKNERWEDSLMICVLKWQCHWESYN